MVYPSYDHHNHPIIILAKSDCKDKSCVGCGCTCTGITYGCKKCDFFVHYSCLELPKQLFFPNHPSHPPLALYMQRDVDPFPLFTCCQCESPSQGYVFRCKDGGCDYAVDVKCGYPLPTVSYPYHHHSLHFFPKLLEEVQHRRCNTCDEPCKSDVLCCLRCSDFAIHSQCIGLSCLFSHGCHYHREKLEFKALAEEVGEYQDGHDDKNDEDKPSSYRSSLMRTEFSYDCDICGDEIKAQTPVYYCKSCLYIVHVTCLFSKVFSKAKDRRMELKMIREEGESEIEDTQTEHVDTFATIIKDFNNYEKSQLEAVYRRRVAEIIKVLAWRPDVIHSSSRIYSPFSGEAFLQFTRRLLRGIEHPCSLAVASKDDRVVEVAEYKVTEKLAPILETLFANHGDVSAESELTPKPKILVFIMLCSTVDSMWCTKVVDVTESLLYNWWKYLIFVHLAGFQIQFAIDQLKVVVCAHYNLQDWNNSVTRMEKEIMDLSDQIKEHEAALKHCKSKLKIMKGRHRSIKPEMDDRLMEAYSKNAFAWKWETADDP